MGLLSEEAVGEIHARLNPDEPSADATTDASSKPESEQVEPTSDAPQDANVASSDATEDVKQDVEADSSDDGAEPAGSDQEHSHHVPYNRFKKVLDARNTHKDEVAQLKREMARLREQMSAPDTTDDDDIGDYLGGTDLEDFGDDYSDMDEGLAQPDVGPQMAEVLQRIERFEVYQAEQELQREVAAAKKQYPSVPDDVIYEAVARDPSVSVLSIAEHYSSFVGGVEEAAIARYLKDNGIETPQAEAPPRPDRSGAPPRSSYMPEGQAPPSNLKEAKSALMAYLNKNNIFKT